LSLTGYTCGDLFQQQLLLEEAENAVFRLLELSRGLEIVGIVGVPVPYNGRLLNCAAVFGGGKLYGLVPKTFLPNYKEFYEQRWFASGANVRGEVHYCGQQVPIGPDLLFATRRFNFGIELCEDLWAVVPPSSRLSLEGADIIFNLSASDEIVGKYAYLRGLVAGQSARCIGGYVYAGAGWGESTQDLVFSGLGIIAENGRVLKEGDRFLLGEQLVSSEIDVERLRSERRQNTTFGAEHGCGCGPHGAPFCRRIAVQTREEEMGNFALSRTVNPLPFVPEGDELDRRCEDIICIQSEALARRIEHTNAKTVVLGVSGGLDSTLALLVCANAFDSLNRDRKGIVGITMPGFGTTDRTYTNAINLMNGLGITIREISIKEACEVHFRDLAIDPNQHDTTYENSQARERTQILMDAANQMGGFVVGTGDLSELALGWATYNGDHMSMYGVNAGVPKTLVRHLVRFFAHRTEDKYVSKTLLDIVDTPISPELIPADKDGQITQKTEDLVGPYELHDFFLYCTLRHGFRPTKTFHLACLAFDGTNKRVSQYDERTIAKWLQTFFRRFFAQQFKRSCLPDGPKVGSCSLSPRGDWRMPSDASSAAWLKECEGLVPPEEEVEERPELTDTNI